MRIVLFYHSLLSDWNHGNAHFLRGIAAELIRCGHEVTVCEPADGWSRANLLADEGPEAGSDLFDYYPELRGVAHLLGGSPGELEGLLAGADLVLVHEWNDPELVARIGRLRREGGYRLLFHDTHHRSATDPEAMAAYDLRDYDGVLAFGGVIREIYLDRGWTDRAWTWHEAADIRVFRPLAAQITGDLCWIGNWGDSERSRELAVFLLEPVAALGLKAAIWGVRYPEAACRNLAAAGIAYRGWLPNYRAPEVFARHRVTAHVPRGPYASRLPGIPTIRPFEAMACGVPLVCSPWDDCEGLFRPGQDYLVAGNGREMRDRLRDVLHDPGLAMGLAASGRATILARHTCAHRVDELFRVYRSLAGTAPRQEEAHA
jgi:spore maturation protein CgeB